MFKIWRTGLLFQYMSQREKKGNMLKSVLRNLFRHCTAPWTLSSICLLVYESDDRVVPLATNPFRGNSTPLQPNRPNICSEFNKSYDPLDGYLSSFFGGLMPSSKTFFGPLGRRSKIFFITRWIFKESALWPIISISRDVRMFVCVFVCPSHPGNHASRWIRDLWSKGVSLILAYL